MDRISLGRLDSQGLVGAVLNMLVIGLTGGIGSGKSAVADLFAKLHVPIVDTDLIARRLVAPGETALQEIVEAFGPEVLQANGELDRGKLAQISFVDDSSRKRLESILHPRIRQAMRAQLQASQGDYAIAVIPLLAEKAMQDEVDRVLVVDCPEALQVARVKQRDGRSDEQIKAIMLSQVSRQQRLALADDVIENTGSLQQLESLVVQLHHKYQRLSSAH